MGQAYLGVWVLPVQLLGSTTDTYGYDLGRIIIDFIFWVPVSWACYVWWRPSPIHSAGKAFDGIRWGVLLLWVWYLVTIVDLLLHISRVETQYGYVVSTGFYQAPRFAGDVLFLISMHHVVWSEVAFQIREGAITWRLAVDFVVLVIIVLVLFAFGSQVASDVLWLQVTDSDVLQQVYSSRGNFEAAYTILYWLLALAILFAAIFYSKDPFEVFKGRGEKITYLILAATTLFWIRSMSEFIYVCHYNLERNLTPVDARLARDTVYGLCTSTLLILMFFIAQHMPEANPGNSIKSQIQDECRRYLLGELERRTQDGTRDPPPLKDMLDNMKRDPAVALAPETIISGRRLLGRNSNESYEYMRVVREYVTQLGQEFGDLKPLAARES